MLYERFGSQIHDVVAQHAPQQELHREIVNPLGRPVFTGTTGPHPAVGNQVTNETAGGLESLPRVCYRGINQVLTQEISLDPLLFVRCQSEPSESSNQGRIGRIANRARL